ncbi:hypothetical protein FF098_003510 [Parvularcula flava]|uniref:Uncharacterized protein n=1 Tax=Aquisalinus luteolus TaxID=1566827 RepID=A0A8J3A4W8_9PROT|nr:hypothetical protein [Aquisalinus luteolus]NHK26975.1 hypothetical protein [Aquisalinus luteolus]GGH93983.1 hypothetical protein GCM10011355_07100 [Aquisalinus luteolus]
MKPKLRSGQLATSALGLTARNIPLIIRLFLFPALAVLAIEVIYLVTAFGDLWLAILQGDAGAIEAEAYGPSYYLADGARYVISMILFAPGTVRLSRIIAGDIEPPGGFWHFSFGAREWRYAIASVLVAAVSWIFFLALPGGLSEFVFGNFMPDIYALLGIPEGMEVWIFLALLIGMVWLSVKLIPYLPMVAIENRLDIGRGLGLSFGNFWNIFGALILFGIILIGLYIALMIIVAIVIMIAAFIGIMVAGIEDSTHAAEVGTMIGFAIGFVAGYGFSAFSASATFVLAALVYLGIVRPTTEQDLIDKLDDTPINPEDEPDPDGQDSTKKPESEAGQVKANDAAPQ